LISCVCLCLQLFTVTDPVSLTVVISRDIELN